MPTALTVTLAILGIALGWRVDPTFYGLVAIVGTDLPSPAGSTRAARPRSSRAFRRTMPA
jgi:hypothetical protein